MRAQRSRGLRGDAPLIFVPLGDLPVSQKDGKVPWFCCLLPYGLVTVFWINVTAV